MILARRDALADSDSEGGDDDFDQDWD